MGRIVRWMVPSRRQLVVSAAVEVVAIEPFVAAVPNTGPVPDA
ncbi:MAG: hypothetical protein WKF58_09985 [Ilumatobacteraceae bacterium]